MQEDIGLTGMMPLGGAGPITPAKEKGEEEDDDEKRQRAREKVKESLDPIQKYVGINEDGQHQKDRHALITGQALEEYKNYKNMLADKRWKLVPYTGADGISCYELPVTYREDSKEAVYAIKASGCVVGKTADDIAK
jgi:hypothetical protein